MSRSSDQPAPDEPPAAATAPDQAPGGEIEPQRVGPPSTRPPGADLRRVAIGAGAALLVLAFGGVVFAATQLARPGVTAVAPEHLTPDRDVRRDAHDSQPHPPVIKELRERLEHRGKRGEEGRPFPGQVAKAFREITISAISGSDVTLATEDGWTRTITLTETTTITRAGETIGVAELKVGDEVRFRQHRGDDGTYTVTAIEVVLPHVVGRVSAISGDAITVERRDGTSTTVRVGTGTSYHVRGVESAALSDITVGMLVVALGEQNADGSLQAVAVTAGARK